MTTKMQRPTCNLRWKEKKIYICGDWDKELVLQQMWVSDNGDQEWWDVPLERINEKDAKAII